MVSQDSPPPPPPQHQHQHQHQDTTNILLHQFITTQNQFDHHHHHQSQQHHFDAYNHPPNTLIPHSSIGLLPTNHNHNHNHSTTIQSLGEESAQMSHTRRLMDLLGATTTNDTNQQQQRLSLSLNSHNILVPQHHHHQYKHRPLTNSNDMVNYSNNNNNNDDEYPFASSSSSSRHCSNLYGGVIATSRYLKPTQSLLEEMVNVGGREVDLSNEKYIGNLLRGSSQRGGSSLSSELRAELCSAGGLLSSDKQEAQLKLAKLISLLQEVENRYEKYYHQMEEVMSTFEVIAGQGKAKPYTALALQAMSRHFCSLRDAVVSRINAERRKLAQDLPKISAGLSQLSLFDREPQSCGNNARISLQHLGLIQTQQRQAWRPIRGLPETSVAILRAWLFEHFLHPYPNDSEKLMLASQTGLSKNQVSNWFINARVRLWKPMIEEMYKEEFGDSSEDSNPLGGGCVGGGGGGGGSLANEGVSVTDHEEE